MQKEREWSEQLKGPRNAMLASSIPHSQPPSNPWADLDFFEKVSAASTAADDRDIERSASDRDTLDSYDVITTGTLISHSEEASGWGSTRSSTASSGSGVVGLSSFDAWGDFVQASPSSSTRKGAAAEFPVTGFLPADNQRRRSREGELARQEAIAAIGLSPPALSSIDESHAGIGHVLTNGNVPMRRFSSADQDTAHELDTHTVGPTDTLAGLAILYGVSKAELKRVNRLWNDDDIRLRQKIYIPGRTGASGSVSGKQRALDNRIPSKPASGLSEKTSDSPELADETMDGLLKRIDEELAATLGREWDLWRMAGTKKFASHTDPPTAVAAEPAHLGSNHRSVYRNRVGSLENVIEAAYGRRKPNTDDSVLLPSLKLETWNDWLHGQLPKAARSRMKPQADEYSPMLLSDGEEEQDLAEASFSSSCATPYRSGVVARQRTLSGRPPKPRELDMPSDPRTYTRRSGSTDLISFDDDPI
ncbi:hypothetical protein BC832DRAFT_556000 [Gaertneriomyces semiglobifer]|nr:hypothetical protein BC832DRAFT_556000 [Gaertneriomyces semiglobifer]